MQPITILLYHQVGPEPKPGANPSCFCNIDRFRAQMQYLRESEYSIIGLRQAYECLYVDNTILPQPAVVLTFDDGDISFYEVVAPILQTFAYPAVVFAVPGLLGQRTDWIKLPCARVPVMSASQLRSVHALGFEVGSHSLTHQRLSRLSNAQMVSEIRDSKEHLEAILEDEVYSFAYPHGDHSDAVTEAVRASGYRCAVTCQPGDAGATASPYEIPREYITFEDDLMKFKSKLPLVM